jgi:dihydrofolate reductase
LTANEKEVFVIGGSQLYSAALQGADRVYMTEIHRAFDGDAFFQHLPAFEWKETARDPQAAAGDASLRFDFVIYERAR